MYEQVVGRAKRSFQKVLLGTECEPRQALGPVLVPKSSTLNVTARVPYMEIRFQSANEGTIAFDKP